MRRWLCLLLACSGPAHHEPISPHHASDAGVAGELPISQSECDDLVTHVVQAVGSDRPEADQVAARADMHRDCKGMTRAQLSCAMAATTRAEVEACDLR